MKVVNLLLLLSLYIYIATGINSEEQSVFSEMDGTCSSSTVEQMDTLTTGESCSSYTGYEIRVMELNNDYINKSTEFWVAFGNMPIVEKNDRKAYERHLNNLMGTVDKHYQKYLDLGVINNHDETRLNELLVEYEKKLLKCYNKCKTKIDELNTKQRKGDALEVPGDGNSNNNDDSLILNDTISGLTKIKIN